MTLRSRVYDIAKVTPYEEMPGLSERVAAKCYAKREDTQPGFSNNLRGVYNRMFNLTEAPQNLPPLCCCCCDLTAEARPLLDHPTRSSGGEVRGGHLLQHR